MSKNANLLLTILNPWSKIIARVGEGVFDAYMLHRTEPKGIGAVWKDGDMISYLKHQRRN